VLLAGVDDIRKYSYLLVPTSICDTVSMPLLDHIVVLVPSLTEAISSYRAAGFTIIPGGAHAGGVTENALLILPDKVYLELIAFRSSASPSERAKHRWGNRLPGLIDWAVAPGKGKTLDDELSRAQVGNLYEEPQPGGRTTPEGRVLEWETASPKQLTEQDPGVLPFFCADITPRDWRVRLECLYVSVLVFILCKLGSCVARRGGTS
jgi:hypothetical protein